MTPQANPFGRTRDEMASTEELLANINKPLPFSEEGEKGLLSCLLQDPNGRIDDCSITLPPAAFHHEANRTIYATILEFHGRNLPIDPVMITETLRKRGLLDRVGGPSAITELFIFVPSPSHYTHYKKIILDAYRTRSLIHALLCGVDLCQQFGKTSPQDKSADALDESVDALAEQVHGLLAKVRQDDGSPDLPCVPIKQLVAKVIESASERAENPGRMLGVSTGFSKIDEDTSGIQTGQFITVLGGTSMGKSLLARQMLESWCEAGHAAVIYTWEMQDTQETTRLLCSQGKISNKNFKSGIFSRAEQQALAKASRVVSEMNIDIVDCGGRCIEDVWRDIARRTRRLPPGVDLLAEIDYIQLALTRRQFPKQRQQQIAYITQGCKQAAKSSRFSKDTPPRAAIIGLSQVNKEGDAREGEDIINDSDVAIKILPRSTSTKESKAPAWKRAKKTEEEQDDSSCILFMAKVRDGKRFGRHPVRKLGEMFRFEEVQHEPTEDQ